MTTIEAEARTRIIWGESPAEVVKFLTRNGQAVQHARDVVDKLLSERSRIVRRRGVRHIVLGLSACIIGAGMVAGTFLAENPVLAAFDGHPPGGGIACGVIGFCWGLWKFADGLRDLLRPMKAAGDLGFHGEQF